MDFETTKLPIEENLKKEDLTDSLKLAELIVAILDSKKAKDIKLLHVENQTIIADYFVICTGTSRTQIRSLAGEVEFKLEPYEIAPIHTEGGESGIWILQDYGSVILHIFSPDARDFYKLDKLYMDTTEKDISAIVTED